MTIYTEPYEWVNEDLVDSLDMNDFCRDNITFLFNEAASASLISITRPTVTSPNRNPDWKDIDVFTMITYGKDIYSSLEFDIVNGSDTWAAGTVFVGADDVTDVVEKVGERITRVAVRDGYTRSKRWQNLLRQRQNLSKTIEEIQEAAATYRGVNAVFGGGRPPLDYLNLGHAVSSRDARYLRILADKFGNRGNWQRYYQPYLNKLNQQKDEINRQMRQEGVVWRHKNIFVAGQDRKVAQSSEVVQTRVTTQVETIQYDRVFLRLLIDGNQSREFIHESGTRSESGAYYIPNIPAGIHTVRLQWRSPQFTGHQPLSGTLISLRNLNIQLKEVRDELLDIVT